MIYSVVLVSAVQQSDSVTHIYIYIIFHILWNLLSLRKLAIPYIDLTTLCFSRLEEKQECTLKTTYGL